MRYTRRNPYENQQYPGDQWSAASSTDGSESARASLYGRILLEDDDSRMFTSDEEDGSFDSFSENETEDDYSKDGVSEMMKEEERLIQKAESNTRKFNVVVLDPPVYARSPTDPPASGSNRLKTIERDSPAPSQNETQSVQASHIENEGNKEVHDNIDDVYAISLTHTPSRDQEEADNEDAQSDEERVTFPRLSRKRGLSVLKNLAKKIARKSPARRFRRKSTVLSTKSEETEDTSEVEIVIEEEEQSVPDMTSRDISVEIAGNGIPLRLNEKPIVDFVLPSSMPDDDQSIESAPNLVTEYGAIAAGLSDDESTSAATTGYEIELDSVDMSDDEDGEMTDVETDDNDSKTSDAEEAAADIIKGDDVGLNAIEPVIDYEGERENEFDVESKKKRTHEPVVEAKKKRTHEPVVEAKKTRTREPIVASKKTRTSEPVAESKKTRTNEPVAESKKDRAVEPIVESKKERRKRRRQARRKRKKQKSGSESDGNSMTSKKSVGSRLSNASKRSWASLRSKMSLRPLRQKQQKKDDANADLYDEEETKEERKRRFFRHLREKKRKRAKEREEEEMVGFCEFFADSCYFFQCFGEETGANIFDSEETKRKKRRKMFSKRAW